MSLTLSVGGGSSCANVAGGSYCMTRRPMQRRAPQVLWEHWKEVIWDMCLGTPKDEKYVVYVLVDHQRWLCRSVNAIYS